VNLSPFSGEQVVQVANPDPFAKPVLRSPVLHTPVWIIAAAQLFRCLWRLTRFLLRHPVIDGLALLLVLVWRWLGWPGPVIVLAVISATSVVWRLCWRDSFTRLVWLPAGARVRRWRYARQWPAVMTISRLTVVYRGRLLLPALGQVTTTGYTDLLSVRLVPGQSDEDFTRAATALAHAFGAVLCRIRTAVPGAVVVELVRRDALAVIIPAFPVPAGVDLRAVAIGRHENGALWRVRLHGSHILLAGSTGAGKASVLWAIVRGILPVLADGTARILGADPKRMELAYGRQLFEAFGHYESDPGRIVVMLETAVTEMQARASVLAGVHRDHTPTSEHPFTVIFVDEVAFLTAYQPDRKLRERALAAIATLTTQGRAVGYCVVGALQDPRKDVLTIRNLFPDRIAMRLDEPEQVDMVLGDGARDRGALADLISASPATGAGIAYVRLEASPDPTRVRAAWVSDTDIRAMCDRYAPHRTPLAALPTPRSAA
jgi:S-DNA-T family DNA segregation ATPase FtsK/SpoIIIE